MNRLISLILVIAAGAFVYKKFKQPALKDVSIAIHNLRGPLSDYKVDQGAQIDKCFVNRKNCVLIYVAPWCPACHDFLRQYPRINAELDKKNIGTLIIVGADDIRSKEVAFKEELGTNAILDTVDGDFRKKNVIESFPTILVTDSVGKVIANGSDSFKKINQFLNEN